jgi:ribulose-phosphate 3-epimerase
MIAIPSINCGDFSCIREKFEIVNSLGSKWAHLDITDGKFSKYKTWNNPAELGSWLKNEKFEMNFEVHLMVQNPERVSEDWLKAGVKRLIVHLEAIRDANIRMHTNDTNGDSKLNSILEKCANYEVELVVALRPETPADAILDFADSIFMIQLLAVSPGPSGQEFNQKILEKMEYLKERLPDVLIEVDGGINPETARLAARAGADIVVAGSYIFNHRNPSAAFRELEII